MIIVDENLPEGDIPPPFASPRSVHLKEEEDVRDNYDLKTEIGRGRFGTVYLCTCKKSGQKFAAKFVNTKRTQDRTNVEREIEIMRVLNEDGPHQKLIQLYDAYDLGKEICLVLEVVQGGELFERVIDDDFELTERACAIFLRQICEGIEFIHSKNILHLDMKPENILCLTREGNRIKICDFGLARKYDPRKKLQVLFGTPEFVAPEVVNFEPIGFGTDMWSVGVICYVLLSGLSPFMGHNYVETMTNVTHNDYDFDDEAFDEVSDEVKDFIERLLLLDKSERLTPEACLRHRWLRNIEGLPKKFTKKKELETIFINDLKKSDSISPLTVTEDFSGSSQELIIDAKLDIRFRDIVDNKYIDTRKEDAVRDVQSEEGKIEKVRDEKQTKPGNVIEADGDQSNKKEKEKSEEKLKIEKDHPHRNSSAEIAVNEVQKDISLPEKTKYINTEETVNLGDLKETDFSEKTQTKDINDSIKTKVTEGETTEEKRHREKPKHTEDSEIQKADLTEPVSTLEDNDHSKATVNERKRGNNKRFEKQELERTKSNLKEFVKRWNSHPNSPYSIDSPKVPQVICVLSDGLYSRASFGSMDVAPPSEMNISDYENDIDGFEDFNHYQIRETPRRPSLLSKEIVEELEQRLEDLQTKQNDEEIWLINEKEILSSTPEPFKLSDITTDFYSDSANVKVSETTRNEKQKCVQDINAMEKSQQQNRQDILEKENVEEISTSTKMKNDSHDKRPLNVLNANDLPNEPNELPIKRTRRDHKDNNSKIQAEENVCEDKNIVIQNLAEPWVPTKALENNKNNRSNQETVKEENVLQKNNKNRKRQEQKELLIQSDQIPYENDNSSETQTNNTRKEKPNNLQSKELNQEISTKKVLDEQISKAKSNAPSVSLSNKANSKDIQSYEVNAEKIKYEIFGEGNKKATNKDSTNVKHRPSRDVPSQPDKKELFEKDLQKMSPDVSMSPISTPGKRSRRHSRDTDERTPVDSDRSTPIRVRRRPSRDVSLSISQTDRISSLTSSKSERKSTVDLWPDMICLSKDEAELSENESDYQPITAKLELPMKVPSTLQNNVPSPNEGNSSVENKRGQLKKVKSLDDHSSVQPETKTVTWVLDLENAKLPYISPQPKVTSQDQATKTKDNITESSNVHSNSQLPEDKLDGPKRQLKSPITIQECDSFENLTIQTPWGPMKKASSKPSTKSSDDSTIINISECFINITKTKGEGNLANGLLDIKLTPSPNTDIRPSEPRLERSPAERRRRLMEKYKSDNDNKTSDSDSPRRSVTPENYDQQEQIRSEHPYSLASSESVGKHSSTIPNNIRTHSAITNLKHESGAKNSKQKPTVKVKKKDPTNESKPPEHALSIGSSNISSYPCKESNPPSNHKSEVSSADLKTSDCNSKPDTSTNLLKLKELNEHKINDPSKQHFSGNKEEYKKENTSETYPKDEKEYSKSVPVKLRVRSGEENDKHRHSVKPKEYPVKIEIKPERSEEKDEITPKDSEEQKKSFPIIIPVKAEEKTITISPPSKPEVRKRVRNSLNTSVSQADNLIDFKEPKSIETISKEYVNNSTENTTQDNNENASDKKSITKSNSKGNIPQSQDVNAPKCSQPKEFTSTKMNSSSKENESLKTSQNNDSQTISNDNAQNKRAVDHIDKLKALREKSKDNEEVSQKLSSLRKRISVSLQNPPSDQNAVDVSDKENHVQNPQTDRILKSSSNNKLTENQDLTNEKNVSTGNKFTPTSPRLGLENTKSKSTNESITEKRQSWRRSYQEEVPKITLRTPQQSDTDTGLPPKEKNAIDKLLEVKNSPNLSKIQSDSRVEAPITPRENGFVMNGPSTRLKRHLSSSAGNLVIPDKEITNRSFNNVSTLSPDPLATEHVRASSEESSYEGGEGNTYSLKRKSKINFHPSSKKPIGCMLFSAQDRILQFEKKRDEPVEKRVQKPISRSRTNTHFGDTQPKVDVKSKFNRSSLCERNNNSPSVVCSKSDLSNIEFMRSRLMHKAYSITSLPNNIPDAADFHSDNPLERAQSTLYLPAN